MRFFIVLLIVFFIFPGVTLAETIEEGILSGLDIEASGSLDVYTEYIWRGFALDTDPVLQPGFELSGCGFTFGFWSNWDFDNNDELDGDEIDYFMDYTYDFDYASVSAGHTYYEFPGTDTFSREFYAGISFPVFLSPALTYYYDYGEEDQGGADGSYLTLDFSHSFELTDNPGITFDLGARVSYNRELFIEGEGGDALFTAGLTVPLAKGLDFSPSINYSLPYGDLDDAQDGDQKDRFYYGFSLTYSF